MTNEPTIIHISGESGCGKTTLGKQLKGLFKNIVVIDTDAFYQFDDDQGKLLIEKRDTLSEKDYIVFFNDNFQKIIKNINEKNSDKIIIYTGLLDHMSFYGVYNKIDTPNKFYYDTDIDVFLQRFYIRLASNLPSFVDRVINDEYYIEDSKTLIEKFKKTKENHVKMGYLVLEKEELISKIKEIVELHEKKHQKITIN